MDTVETFQMPPLFFILCAMSAMAFVVSAYLWLWQVYRGLPPARDFQTSVWMAQFPAFLCSSVMSLFVGLHDYIYADVPPSIVGEVLILGLMIVLLLLSPASQVDTFSKRLRFMVMGVLRIFAFGGLCVVGWAFTVGFGFLLLALLRIIAVMTFEDLQIVSCFLSGLMWTVPILWMYSQSLKRENAREFLGGQGIRNFLWPVLAAYFMLLIPFLIQNIANSSAWHDAKNQKPIRTAESVFFGHDLKERLLLSPAPV